MTQLEPSSRPQKSDKPLCSLILSGLVVALTGLVCGFWKLSVTTLPHIIMPDGTRRFQEVSDSLPVPQVLDWNLTLIQFMEAMNLLKGVMLIVAGVALFGVALALVFDQVKPVALKEESESDQTATPAETDAPATPSKAKSADSPLIRIMAILLVFGILLRFALPEVSQTLLLYYHTMGTFHQGHWQEIAFYNLALIFCLWFATGFALVLLLKTGVSMQRRALFALIPLAFALFAFLPAKFLQPSFYAASRDWTPAVLRTALPPYDPNRESINADTTLVGGVPGSYQAAKELADRTKIKIISDDPAEELNKVLNGKDAPDRSVLIFLPDRYFSVTMRGCSEDGLSMSSDSETKVNAFLKAKKNESSLSWIAIKHLYNIRTSGFDLAGAIQICLDDMKTNPHLAQCNQTVRDSLFIASASKASREALDQYADTRYFSFPTRACLRQLGDLYVHFGDKEEAMKWYLKADMPRTFLDKIRMEKPLFHIGHVSGVLTLNGKPLAGARVGVFPTRLNALPKDLEVRVLHSVGELLSPRWQSMVFPNYHPRPFAFRWVSAGTQTDAAGKFELDDLTEGEYQLITALPADIHLEIPNDPKLTVENPPVNLLLNYKRPEKKLGTINLKLK